MKEFDEWNKVKQAFEKKDTKLFFKEREIWWTALGHNIGQEENGKNKNFERPVLILKKISRNLFIGIPTTTKYKGEFYKSYIGIFNNKKVYIIWNQIRILSTKRLIRKSRIVLPKQMFESTKHLFCLYLK
jgi:mRNA interferase MazF